MINLSEIVARTERMFDIFNEHFYGNELARPVITVSSDAGRGAYGWCSVYEVWEDKQEGCREINITAEYIDRPITEVAATMLHEMAHLCNLTNKINDVSNNRYYHNKCFKETAEAHGLAVAHHEKYGWTISTLTVATAEWLFTVPEIRNFTAGRKMVMQTAAATGDSNDGEQPTPKTGKAGTVTQNRSIKYVCPKCGMIIRATRMVNVICGDCGVTLEAQGK